MSWRVKNWKDFQHFKDRKPPWIKLYRDLLDDPDWHELDGDDAKALVMLWLIASEDSGNLPDIRKISFRLRITQTKTEQLLNRLSHWLEHDDVNAISGRHQVDAPETEEETEREVEEETDIRAVAKATRPSPESFLGFWKAYPSRGKAANPRKPAQDKFDAALRRGVDPEVIIGGAQRYAAVEYEANRVGTEKIAQAMTWLNQERWNDYPAPSAPSSGTGPPKPPSPDLPSDEELRAKYANRRETEDTPAEATRVLEESPRVCSDTENGVGSDPKGFRRVSSVASLFQTTGMEAFCDTADGDEQYFDDGDAGRMARVVR